LSKRRPGHWYSQRPTCCHRPTSQLRPTSGSWAHWLTATLALKRLPRKRTDWPRLWPQGAFGRFSYKLRHLTPPFPKLFIVRLTLHNPTPASPRITSPFGCPRFTVLLAFHEEAELGVSIQRFNELPELRGRPRSIHPDVLERCRRGLAI
jgi:hypothetical protein